jgi:hypothetical protein
MGSWSDMQWHTTLKLNVGRWLYLALSISQQHSTQRVRYRYEFHGIANDPSFLTQQTRPSCHSYPHHSAPSPQRILPKRQRNSPIPHSNHARTATYPSARLPPYFLHACHCTYTTWANLRSVESVVSRPVAEVLVAVMRTWELILSMPSAPQGDQTTEVLSASSCLR